MLKKSAVVLVGLIFILLTGSHLAVADSYSFSTIPADGNVAGPPGSTVGWGYSITDQSSQYWLVIVALSAGPFLNGVPNAIFDFPTLAPGTNAMEIFDPNSPSGLYELTWDSTAPSGFVNSGLFTLSAEWWSGDPLNGGMFVMDAPDSSASYSATVASSGTVSEPSSLALLPVGLGGLLALRRKLRV